MTRLPRLSKDAFEIKAFLILGGIIFAATISTRLIERFGESGLILLIICLLFLSGLFAFLYKSVRIKKLMQKYDDAEIVKKIMDRTIWQNQTADQLIDALGEPVTIENQMLKTKKKEIWKYHPIGKKRFNLKITLENDLVTVWKN